MNKRLTTPIFDSNELSKEFPFLVHDPFWKQFKKHFDNENAKNKRITIYKTAQGTIHDKGISKINLYAKVLTNPMFAKLLKDRVTIEKASKELGLYFLQLTSEIDKVEALLQKVKLINKQSSKPKGYLAQIALLFFVYREERLPSKAELNNETWHYKNSTNYELKSSNNNILYKDLIGDEMVYKYYPDDQGDEALLIHKSHWNQSNIDSSEWSKDIIKALGFKGLPTSKQVNLG